MTLCFKASFYLILPSSLFESAAGTSALINAKLINMGHDLIENVSVIREGRLNRMDFEIAAQVVKEASYS